MTTTAHPTTSTTGGENTGGAMRLQADRAELRRALKAVTPAVARATQAHFPALAGVRIDTDDTGATFTGSRLDFTIRHRLEGADTDPGTAVVAASLLARLLAKLPAGPVTIRATNDGGQVVVEAGDAAAELRAFPPGDWPALPVVDTAPVTLDAEQLELLRRLLPMAATDDARPTIASVHLVDGRAEATDSYRLAFADLALDGLAEVAIPTRALAAVLAATKGADELAIAVDARAAAFTAGPTSWTTSLRDADDYPSMVAFRDRRPAGRVEADADRLAEAVDRTRAMGADAGPVVLQLEGDKLTITRTATDVGTLTDHIPATGTVDRPVAFNPDYLLELITAVAPDGGPLALELDDGLRPAYARTDRLTVALMPVRHHGAAR